jgi:hypothetical protein
MKATFYEVPKNQQRNLRELIEEEKVTDPIFYKPGPSKQKPKPVEAPVMPAKDLKVLDGDALKQLNLDLGDVLDQLLKSVESTTLQSLPFLEIESFVPKTEEKEDTITDADIFAMLQSASDPFASFKKEEAQELDYVNLKEGLQILNQVDNGSNKFVNEALRKKQ